MFSEINGELKVINSGIRSIIGRESLEKNHRKLISLTMQKESVFQSFTDENMFCLYRKAEQVSFLSGKGRGCVTMCVLCVYCGVWDVNRWLVGIDIRACYLGEWLCWGISYID